MSPSGGAIVVVVVGPGGNVVSVVKISVAHDDNNTPDTPIIARVLVNFIVGAPMCGFVVVYTVTRMRSVAKESTTMSSPLTVRVIFP